MFESTFEKIGRGVSKNSGKIIIIWLIFILLMSYGATLVFSNTNFNIQSSFGGGTSEAQVAQNQLSQYFPSDPNGSSNGTQILIVTQNTYVNNTSDFSTLVKYEQSLSRSLNGTPGFTGVQSIISTESSSMNAFSSGMKTLLQGNAGAVQVDNGIINQTIFSSYLFLTVEEVYLNYFNTSHNLSISYNSTLSFIKNIQTPFEPIQIQYLDAFSHNVNISGSSIISNPVGDIQKSSQDTLKNNSFAPYLHSLGPLNASSIFVIGNQNLSAFMSNSILSTLNLSSQFFPSYVLPTGSNTSSLMYLIESVDKFTLFGFTSQVFNTTHGSLNISGNTTDYLSSFFTSRAATIQFDGNPFLEINPTALSSYFKMLANFSAGSTVQSYMTSHSIYGQPIYPTPYLMHNFVGVNNKTVLFVFTFNGNYTAQQANIVTSSSGNFSAQIHGSTFLIAGTEQFASQLSSEISSGLVKALAIGVMLSILVIGLFFKSIKAAFIPILLFMISAVISLGIIGLIYTYIFHSQISFITPTLLFIFILGLTSDYTVYIMARYRRELIHKTEHPTIITSRWAGHAVFTSGLTVILSQVVLWLINIPFFSDSGFANAIGVFVSLMLATTFLPSILHRYGKSIFRKSAEGRTVESEHLRMQKVGRFTTENRYAMIAVFFVIIIIGVYIYQATPESINILKLLPQSQAITAIDQINNSFNGDFLDRGFIVVGLAAPLIVNGKVNQTEMSTVNSIENKTLSTSGISEVYGPGRPFGYFTGYNPSSVPASQAILYENQSNSFISSTNSRYVEIVFQTYILGWENKAISTVNVLNSNIQASGNENYTIAIGGLTESLSNAYSSTQSAFLELVPILSITIFALLAIQLSSVISPTRLILMVIGTVVVALSIGYGIFHYIQGYPVIIFMPVFVFTTLLAVGVDYDVFMITRVREEIIKGNDIDTSIITSVKENGAVVMLLGTTLFVTFAALYFSSIPLMQQLGVGIALGVLLDTFLSWQFFIPAFMKVLGKSNWWPAKFGKSTQKK